MTFQNIVHDYGNGVKSGYSIEELIENGKNYRKEITELKRKNEILSKKEICHADSCGLVGRLQLKIDKLIEQKGSQAKYIGELTQAAFALVEDIKRINPLASAHNSKLRYLELLVKENDNGHSDK